MKFISFPIFLVSLSIGLFIVYISLPKMKIIYVYPTPDNEDKITYQDKADNCFHFKSIEIDCPNDETKIRSYNIQ
jgi:hypothetical protein